MTGGMTGGMDCMKCRHDPCQLLDMIMKHEQMEMGLYCELAQNAPSMCLRQKIMSLAEMEALTDPVLAAVAGAFGFAPAGPPVAPGGPGIGIPVMPLPNMPGMDPPVIPGYYYDTGEKKEKK